MSWLTHAKALLRLYRSNAFKHKVYEIIFEAETPAGRTIDIALLIAIVSSVGVVMLETVRGVA